MLTLLHALAIMTALFFILLSLKNRIKKSFCAICTASTLTWVILSVFYILDLFDELLLIVLLAGMSLHGVYQLWEERSSRNYLFFRLPVLLTGITVFYQFFVWKISLYAVGFVIMVWLFFSAMYLYRENDKFEQYVEDIIECCRDW